jgi:hypothetical protein
MAAFPVRSALALGLLAALATCSPRHHSARTWAVETTVPNLSIAAGERVNAHCTVTKPDGNEPDPGTVVVTILYKPQDAFSTDVDGAVIATRAGSSTVTCSAPDLGFEDETPIALTVVPAAPHRVFTLLDAATEVAGVPVGVSCLAFDAFDNPVTDLAFLIGTSPSGAGVATDAASITATAAGDYEVSCLVPGASELQTDFLHVRPDVPASVAAALVPEKSFYAIGDEVKVLPVARDSFGNRVDDVEFAYAATPVLQTPFDGRFHFDADGAFVLTADVTSPTLNQLPLSASVPVKVDTAGPAIACRRADAPSIAANAYMLQAAPGSLLVPVNVSDTFDVASVTVNGVAAVFDATTGNYRANVPVGFGTNFFDVVATDMLGLENSTTCTVLAASSFAAEDVVIPGAVALRLDPQAIDGPNGQLDSIGSILQAVLTSAKLRQLVDGGLAAANPINDGSCGIFACEPDVNYNTGSLSWGTPDSTVSLIPGGLRVQLTIPNAHMTVNACGTTCCIGGSTIGVTADTISATVDFDLVLQGGLLRAAVRGSPTVTVGNVNLNGSGFCGFVVNLIQGFFTGTVKNAVRNALASFISTDVGPLLDGVVSSIDISALGTTFQVPRLDGSGSVNVQFGLALSSLDLTTSRALLGIGTRFTPGAVAQVRPSLGIAQRLANGMLDPPGTTATRPVGLTVYEGTFNQVLHALWRGGFFQANLALGGQGTAAIDARLPPVMKVLSGNQAELMLGGIDAQVMIPGVLTNPVSLTFGGRATADLSLQGDDLAFSNLTLTSVYVATDTPLSQGERDALESFLSTILSNVLVGAINDGLPALPIPSFTLPASVGAFGLPAGAQMGIVNPSLNTSGSHAVLTGRFGVQP